MNQSKIVQINRQNTTVNVGTGRKSGRNRRRGCRFACKRVSGRIFQLCNEASREYFASIRLRPRALIQIENKSDCEMYAIIYLGQRWVVRKRVGREQQMSVYVPSLKSLRIEAVGEENTACRGYYSICLL